ncbi:hypothetical protein [Parvibaculum sp.]|uniref:hypothetical protein n=1 Tax=Parvibaculum sp. TaxID=2024848 RepID=UPI003BAA0263
MRCACREGILMVRAGSDREHSSLALLVALIIVGLAVLGFVWYGVSSEVLQRQWQDLTGRPSGSMSFRFLLQPTMAAIAATYDGIRDAKLGRSPYFWTIINDAEKRAGRLREGLVSTARIMLLGMVMDVIYQLKELGTFYPGEAIIIALTLAFVPYLLLRGPVERIAQWWLNRPSNGEAP